MSFGLLTEEQARIMQDRYRLQTATGDDIRVIADQVNIIKCLHDQCPHCNGTGVRKDGLGVCFHAISCPCPKCTFTC